MVAGQRLREARKKVNLTQEELANIIGVKAAEVSQYESNKRTPRWPTFNKLLDALHITADEVLGRDVTVHDGEDYEVKMAKEDLQILSSIKENPKLYKALLSDPERNVQVISNNLKRVLPEVDD
ncbi:dNA-binding helix-turn-helix protein [Firmicutes bacterium CAG:822]|nr:dNA-binding helix-turn-helix protein [Firmicutes bacterium CAG:822]